VVTDIIDVIIPASVCEMTWLALSETSGTRSHSFVPNTTSQESALPQSAPHVPTLLFFDNNNPRIESLRRNPGSITTIPLLIHGARSEYQLSAIVYHGSYHFTARIIHETESWKYDGAHNSGEVIKEAQGLDEQGLQTLDGRKAHILLYTPKPGLSLNGEPPFTSSKIARNSINKGIRKESSL
jgi:hypothetical protein